jgi:hypothetical protein
MTVCVGCDTSWPADRFNGVSAYCFKCRIATLEFSYGPRQKAGFHDHTLKEFNDRQIREARANGLDPQPVHTKSTAVPSAGGFDKLSKALAPKEKVSNG